MKKAQLVLMLVLALVTALTVTRCGKNDSATESVSGTLNGSKF